MSIGISPMRFLDSTPRQHGYRIYSCSIRLYFDTSATSFYFRRLPMWRATSLRGDDISLNLTKSFEKILANYSTYSPVEMNSIINTNLSRQAILRLKRKDSARKRADRSEERRVGKE